MLGTRPILIPLSVLLSGSAFLTYFRYLTFPREKYLSRKGRVAGTDVQARAHALAASAWNRETMKIPPISAYLEILSFSHFFPFFPSLIFFINELAWNACPLGSVGSDWEICSDLIRGYFENKEKYSSSDLLFRLLENREWKESREFFSKWDG